MTRTTATRLLKRVEAVLEAVRTENDRDAHHIGNMKGKKFFNFANAKTAESLLESAAEALRKIS